MSLDPSRVDLAAGTVAPLGVATMRRMMGGATMDYRRAPDDCYGDSDAFRRWAALALEAAGRAAAKKAARRR